MPQKRNKKEETLTVYRTLPNMAESLKSAMHKRHKLGLSNTGTVYFKSWQSQLHCIDDTHSHLFMTSSKVTPQQRKRVLQYRYGLLPTYKLLHRYKKSSNTTCPLCGGEDGGHHAVSSCPALSNVVTLRHNDAGTAILKAIHQGCKGRMLVTSDVGWRKRHEAPDLPLPKAATTRNIQAHNLPDSVTIGVAMDARTGSLTHTMHRNTLPRLEWNTLRIAFGRHSERHSSQTFGKETTS